MERVPNKYFYFQAGIQNEDKVCWKEGENLACKRQGQCDFCGTGLCCRKHFPDKQETLKKFNPRYLVYCIYLK